jgi:hypothetical protein
MIDAKVDKNILNLITAVISYGQRGPPGILENLSLDLKE